MMSRLSRCRALWVGGAILALCLLVGFSSPGGSGMGSLAASLPRAPMPDVVPDWSISPPAGCLYCYFGRSVAVAGDVNGDGHADLLVGSNGLASDLVNEGAAFLYYGGSGGMRPEPDWSLEGDREHELLSNAMAGAGDVNGDGYADVIIGAVEYTDTMADQGKAVVYYGSSEGLGDEAGWSALGEQPYAWFGYAVAAAGDVNRDGYGDVLVGAMMRGGGEPEEGKVYLYLGSSQGLASSPSWTAEGDQAGVHLGVSLGGAGDVNGDGYDDVIIGSYWVGEGVFEGRAYVYLGASDSLSSDPDWVQSGPMNPMDGFGSVVAGVGDVNRDGYDDVAVGAYGLGYQEQGSPGAAYLYPGSPAGLAPSPSWSASAPILGTGFGWPIAGVGDFNRDGFADFAIGETAGDPEDPIGAAHLFLGSADLPGIAADWPAISPAMFSGFSMALSGGDINGDGFDDLVVGAPSINQSNGTVFGYYGSPVIASTATPSPTPGDSATPTESATETPSATPEAPTPTEPQTATASHTPVDATTVTPAVPTPTEAETATANPTDTGVPTPTGAETATAHPTDTGVPTPTEPETATVSPTDTGTPTPTGAETATANPTDTGVPSATMTAFPTATNTRTPTRTPTETRNPTPTPYPTPSPGWSVSGTPSSGMLLGYSVGSAGDVNGDGYDDVIVGARDYDEGQTNEGAGYAYHGSASGLSTVAAWSVQADNAYAAMGNSVAGAGDVNGDGFADAIVGAPQFSAGQTSEGRAFVYLGSATGLGLIASWTAEGEQVGASFGWSVASAGDVNADGYDDVIVGARDYDNGETDEGRAYVFLGSSSGLAASPVWTAEGNSAQASFGYVVRGAGDVNGDGFDDVIVTSWRYQYNVVNDGLAYVFLGSPSGPETTPSWVGSTADSFDGYGQAADGAGDVNGDGYADVLVGAPGDSTRGIPGAVHLYEGSALGPRSTPGWSAAGRVGALFGSAVAGVGDFNHDGFDDIAVGAPTDTSGFVYLYLGSAGGPGIAPGWPVRPSGSNNFGGAVGAAGDVNGDGLADVLASDTSVGGGRVYAYYGYGEAVEPPTPTETPTLTATPTETSTETPISPTDTETPTTTMTETLESAWTATPTSTATESRTPTATPTETSTDTPISPTDTEAPTSTMTEAPPSTSTTTPTRTLTATPTLTSTSTVTPPPADFIFADGFESGDLSAWSYFQADRGDLSASRGAAWVGAFGLRAVVDDNRAIFVRDDSPASESRYRARFYLNPNGISMTGGNTFTILRGMNAEGQAVFTMELRRSYGDYQVRASMLAGLTAWKRTGWIPLRDHVHLLEMDWWPSVGNIYDAGLTLWVDGVERSRAYVPQGAWWRLDSVQFGAVAGIDGGTRGTITFDAFASSRGPALGPDPDAPPLPTPPSQPDLIFVDGFESGNLDAWSDRRDDGGDLAVLSEAALAGDWGMQALIDDNSPIYAVDWSPFDEPEYRAGFSFDPNGIVMRTGNAFDLLQLMTDTARSVGRVQLRYQAGGYQLRAGASHDDGSWYYPAWVPISDAPHRLEIRWAASSGPMAVDGSLELRIDGDSVGSTFNMENDGLRVDFVRLGAVAGVDTGTRGRIYLDGFVSRREGEIELP